jgi:hypothetical protein
MLYFGVLVAMAVLYFTDVIDPRDRLGTIPTPALWFGALGGVLISLTGVFEHAADWLPSYRYWHIARPFVGATVGVVAVLIFQAGVLAVGQEVSEENATKDIFYYVIAFFIGYKEAAFRDLIARVGEVIVSPGDRASVEMTITGIDPTDLPATGGNRRIAIRGTGLAKTRAVTFDDQEIKEFEAVADRFVILVAPEWAAGPSSVVISVFGPDDVLAEHDFNFT